VMPDMSGHEVCRRLRADETTCDIPVIFVTAHDGDDAEAFGLDIGAVDFIAKPVNPRIVRARVRTQLLLKAQSDMLREWAYIDSLTGVHNRRHFDERFQSEWRRTARNGTALSVMLVDADHFKLYNDRYGHQAGDRCLRRIAATLKAGLRRPADLVARFGGEEFAFLLPETPLAGAMALAQQLRAAVFAQQIENEDAPGGIVTLSAGVCSRSGPGAGTAAQLLGQVDAQLYLAKAGGRDRVCGSEFVAS
jgi:diguanylate cyclase (GGDEF)-like protein